MNQDREQGFAAREAGQRAFHAGDLCESNPHASGYLRDCWEQGWIQAALAIG